MSKKHDFGGMTIDASEPIMASWGGPAFPNASIKTKDGIDVWGEGGMTLRQYAAIHLKVPDSGTDWLDDMIKQANKIDAELLTHTDRSNTL